MRKILGIRIHQFLAKKVVKANQVKNNHETVIQTGITCKKTLLKSLMNLAYLWCKAQLIINKGRKCFSLLDHQLVTFVCSLCERAKKV